LQDDWLVGEQGRRQEKERRIFRPLHVQISLQHVAPFDLEHTWFHAGPPFSLRFALTNMYLLRVIGKRNTGVLPVVPALQRHQWKHDTIWLHYDAWIHQDRAAKTATISNNGSKFCAGDEDLFLGVVSQEGTIRQARRIGV
jgi:hypothetical protein